MPVVRRLRKLTGVTLCILTALASGCSGGSEGWGVLLWSQNETLYPTGTIVEVTNISQLNETYDIRMDKRSPVGSVAQWRLSFFNRKSRAEDFQTEYAPNADLYAVATLDGLPVREQRDPDAKRSYKLRKGEVAKVLRRDAEKSVAGDIEGYWYQILTEGGISGYSFDKYLEILTLDQLTGSDAPGERDEFLEQFLSSTFRPKYFRYMLDTRRIDLQRFLPDYGIFPDPENHVIHIVTENHSSAIEYSDITRVTEGTHAFEGSTLLMIVKNPYEVNLQYSDRGVQYSEEFVRIDTDIDLLIIEETERRAAIFEEIYNRGNTLTSSAYGTITLTENGGFIWEGYDRLVPGVVNPADGNCGAVDFRLHLGQEPAKRYNGIISFVFDGSNAVHFLYSMEDQGIRLKHLTYTPNNDRPLLVEEEGNSPIVIFFRFSFEEAT
ncbi:MAG: SH3 domain-containing protein [Spirochaetales bacterium]|nr:SH3 domain-containing protein [Spirochaetales bacterium]